MAIRHKGSPIDKAEKSVKEGRVLVYIPLGSLFGMSLVRA